jgi:hypothetical protein
MPDDSDDDPSVADGDLLFTLIAEQAEALRRAGRPQAADLLLALARLHAARVGRRAG